ncbi:MAG TPA: cell division protein FtsQ [Bacteroidetes bacterium]|nr:cell division protein FtsQ [Bacteroidota bacterium]
MAIHHQQNISLTDYRIHISTDNGMFFLNENDVKQIIQDNNYDVGKTSGDLDYNRLEKIIENNSYCENAEIKLSPDGEVNVEILQRVPVLRIINKYGVGFYLDKSGKKLPLSDKFTARVVVATGNISDSGISEDTSDAVNTSKLFQIASFICTDSFLNALIEQINVTNEGEFELIPKVGNHNILLGDEKNLSEKTEKLKIFYREGLSKVGWQQYSVINLKYANQVFATRNDVKPYAPPVIVTVPVSSTDTTKQTNH